MRADPSFLGGLLIFYKHKTYGQIFPAGSWVIHGVFIGVVNSRQRQGNRDKHGCWAVPDPGARSHERGGRVPGRVGGYLCDLACGRREGRQE